MNKIKAIFIEAGHGMGSDNVTPDNGAQGNGTTERAEVIEIAKETLAELLYQKGLSDIYITGVGIDERLSIDKKVKKINDICAKKGYTSENSLLISIHINSGGGTGVEGWHYTKNDISKGFAATIAGNVAGVTELQYRGAKDESTNRHGRLGIIHDSTPLACLIECGFIDTKIDSDLLKDPKKDNLFARGIAQGICYYLNIPYMVQETQIAADVPNDAWFKSGVEFCLKNNLMSLDKNGNFNPAAGLSRAELAVTFERFAKRLNLAV